MLSALKIKNDMEEKIIGKSDHITEKTKHRKHMREMEDEVLFYLKGNANTKAEIAQVLHNLSLKYH
jgi:hypothetical protein